jgi:hypothetical protein
MQAVISIAGVSAAVLLVVLEAFEALGAGRIQGGVECWM